MALLLVPHPEPTALPDLADRMGRLAPVAGVLGGALLLVALVPRTFITLASGAIFGALEGAAYALGAALLAAAIGFAVGRVLGREFVAERVRGRLARLDRWFTRQSVLGVVTVRLLPISGFGLVSYGYGTTGARVLPFLVGSVIASARPRSATRRSARRDQPWRDQLVRRRPGLPGVHRQRRAARPLVARRTPPPPPPPLTKLPTQPPHFFPWRQTGGGQRGGVTRPAS